MNKITDQDIINYFLHPEKRISIGERMKDPEFRRQSMKLWQDAYDRLKAEVEYCDKINFIKLIDLKIFLN
jgi:hypothetical protein